MRKEEQLIIATLRCHDKAFYELILANNDSLLLVNANHPPASLFTSPPHLILEFKHLEPITPGRFFEELLMLSHFNNKQLWGVMLKPFQ